jgi:hypothetical protein
MGAQGGFGGADRITDYEAVAGTGDRISLRQLVNGTRVDVLNNPSGNAVIVLSTPYIDPQRGVFPFSRLSYETRGVLELMAKQS